jgi:hypothetical protein
VELAEANSAYAAYSRSYSLEYQHIQFIWSFNQDGDAALTSVNVIFAMSDPAGFAGYLAVVEDADTGSVIEVSTQMGERKYATDDTWSGYVVSGNSGATNPVYEAYALWAEPSVSVPASGCTLVHCDVGVWPGLTAVYGGSTGIVQAGTDSGIYCIFGCTYYYWAWYEFYPDGAVTCQNFPMSAGDSMGAVIWNHAGEGGSSTVYDVYVNDYTTSRVCSLLDESYTEFTTPYYASFVVERPYIQGSPARLPQFNTISIKGELYYDSALRGMYTPYSNGWYTAITMVNGGYTNDVVNSVSTSHYFNVTWNTSSGT